MADAVGWVGYDRAGTLAEMTSWLPLIGKDFVLLRQTGSAEGKSSPPLSSRQKETA
jgi:hypothetical protein